MIAADGLETHLSRVQGYALVAGLGGLAASVGAALVWGPAFFPSYLVAFLFWVGIALGSISLLLLHNLTGGKWGLLIRRPLEAGAMAIVPMAVLFAPIALGLRSIYPWARAEYIEAIPKVHGKAGYLHQSVYLNETWFLIRAGIMFAAWIGLASLLHRGAIRRGPSAPGESTRAPWLATIGGPGLVLVFLTSTFAAVDWMMSIEPQWYSSIYGAMVIVGWGLITLAAMILTCGLLARVSPGYARVVTPSRIQDLGSLMMAFVMLWAYLSFSQFLIIWAGNLSEEIPWYLRRLGGGWQWVALTLVVFHFFVPFFFLLFRDIKRHVELLLLVALAVMAFHLLDLSWLIFPGTAAPGASRPTIPWKSYALLPVSFVGIGGVWVWAFLWNLKRRPLVPDELADAAPEHDLPEDTPHV